MTNASQAPGNPDPPGFHPSERGTLGQEVRQGVTARVRE